MEEVTENKIPLRNKTGKIVAYALCSQEDFEAISQNTWHLTGSGYAATNKTKSNLVLRYTSMHNFVAMLANLHQEDENNVIDHINSNRLDNRRNNLRSVSKSMNSQNRKKHVNVSSSFHGVFVQNKRFISSIGYKYTRVYIGTFETETDAALAYDTYLAHHPELIHKMNWPERREELRNLPLIYPKTKQNSGSQHIGVSRHQGRWRARITVQKKIINIGLTDSEREAALKYDDYVVTNCLNRKLNFPDRYPDHEVIKTDKVNIDNYTVRIIAESKSDAIILIDIEDYEKVKLYSCYISSDGYPVIKTKPCDQLLSRLIMDQTDSKILIDHVNNNRLDNRKENLRESNYQRNAQNSTKRENTSSKYIGVRKKSQVWQCVVGKYLYSKTVKTEEEAARLRDIYILERFPGSHYKLNFSWTEEDKIKWRNKLD